MKKSELRQIISEEYKRYLMEKRGQKVTLNLTVTLDGDSDKTEEYEIGTFNAMGDAQISKEALQKKAPKNYEYWIK